MKARFIQEIGVRAWHRIYWGKDCTSGFGCHNAMKIISDRHDLRLCEGDWHFAGMSYDVDKYPDDQWPLVCSDCGLPVPSENINRQIHYERLYNTTSGKPEPGDLYFQRIHGPNEYCYHGWSNCNGLHLYAVLPNGRVWDIDGRANNCTMPDDKTHRCWCRHGEPPNITVDKIGNTCQAGAGSILADNYHGFLHNGEFT